MSDFDVTAVELQVAGRALETIAAEGYDDLARLSSRVEHFVGAGWQGTAASSFAGAYAEWSAGATDGLQALTLMGEALGASGRAYTASDAGGAAGLRESGGGA